MWDQTEIALPPLSRGFHLITDAVAGWEAIRTCRVGLLQVHLMHTSASLCLNENAAPAVRRDLERAFNALAPERADYEHDEEGPDDMPAHVKSALLGASLTIPVADGVLKLGVWQGVYLCEHRNHGGRRRLVLTLHGE